jgi:hypothetical protein
MSAAKEGTDGHPLKGLDEANLMQFMASTLATEVNSDGLRATNPGRSSALVQDLTSLLAATFSRNG